MNAQDRAARRRAEIERRRRRTRHAPRRRRPVRRPRILVAAVGVTVLAAAVALMLALRSGGSGPTTAVTFRADEFSYRPADAEVLAGPVDVTLANRGQVGHELVVLAPGVHITSRDQFDETMSLLTIPSIAPGSEVTATVDLPPGAYQVVCLLPGHLEAGMSATLEVVEAPPA